MSYESLHRYSPALKDFQTWGFLEVAVRHLHWMDEPLERFCHDSG